MGAHPGRIEVQGNGYNLSTPVPIFSPLVRGTNSTGLQVPVGQTLALIGGNINIAGGTLTAEQGRIELGSVRDGQVSLGDDLALNYPEAQTFGNIHLSQQALADASGGGVIQVQGNQVSLVDGSLLLIQNQGTQAGGSISVNAAQSLEISGISTDGKLPGGLFSQTIGVGDGADIAVSTRQLALRDGARITAQSYSSARTGNVTTQASDSLQVVGVSFINPALLSSISTTAFSSGDGGDVTVSTQKITILDGGSIGPTTFGIGHGGDVTVNALDSIRLIGQSSIFNSSSIVAVTNGAGDAGQLTLNTSRLLIQDGATVTTATLGSGRAGSLIISATKSIEVSGRSPAPTLPSSVGSFAPIVPEAFRQAYQLPDRPSGNSGSLTINTPRLSIRDGANVSVSNNGTGSAGILRVNANSIAVDRGSAITAATVSGEGGNLDLNVRDVLLLRNNSQITTSAGGNGNGGNIRIGAGSIVAVPNENSDISANSANARGGNVSINTAGIFGIQSRPQDTPSSDITATGANPALSGSVQLNSDRPDPTSGLVELPSAVVDPSRLIAQGCPANQGNSFVISGRGGLPPNPEQQLDDDANWQDRRRLTVAQQTGSGRGVSRQQLGAEETETQRPSEFFNSTTNTEHSEFPYPTPPSITEATEWQATPAGEIILVANTSSPAVQNPFNHPTVCQRR